MFKHWKELFSKEKEEIQVTIEKESVKKSILDFVELPTQEETLDHDLMSELLKFRNNTASLDYLRNEIEQVLHQKDGEIRLMEGFANAMKQKKN